MSDFWSGFLTCYAIGCVAVVVGLMDREGRAQFRASPLLHCLLLPLCAVGWPFAAFIMARKV